MKFFALAAASLVLTTSAVLIQQQPEEPSVVAMLEVAEEGLPTADEVMAFADKNKDGKISKGEALKALKKVAKAHNYKLTKKDIAQAEAIFDLVDQNGDKHIDKKEVQDALDYAAKHGH